MSIERGQPQEVDMRLFIKAVNDQFKLLNARLNELESNFDLNPIEDVSSMKKKKWIPNWREQVLNETKRLNPNETAIWAA